jgi:Ca-activated chloride channel family protein
VHVKQAPDYVGHVVIRSQKPLSVLLVTDGNYFLEKAMASLNLDKPVIMLPTAYEAKTPGDYDVIIFDRYSPKQLPPSGNFIYFDALAPNLKLKIAQQDGHNAMVDDVGVLDWRRDHPMLRYLSLTKLYAAQALKLDVPPEAEVLIEGTKGPMLVLDREGKNTHLVVTFDVLQSNWPLRVSFPIFLHNALQYMAVGSDLDVRQSLEPGATPRIPRANIDRAGEGLKSIRLNGPDGSRELTLTDGAEFALPALDRVGVYTTQPPIPQYERIAVNLLDANESNVMPVETAPGGVGEAIATTAKKSRLELWWWIVACAAIPLLLIEWWVYTRRVHL